MELCNELTIQFCQESFKQGHANKVLSVLLTLRDHKQLQFFQQISDLSDYPLEDHLILDLSNQPDKKLHALLKKNKKSVSFWFSLSINEEMIAQTLFFINLKFSK